MSMLPEHAQFKTPVEVEVTEGVKVIVLPLILASAALAIAVTVVPSQDTLDTHFDDWFIATKLAAAGMAL